MNNELTINQQISNIVEELGFTVYSIENCTENFESIFRINIYSSDKGITLRDCTITHKAIYPLLEENIALKHTIQVGSIGIERPLLEPWHYELVIDKNIHVKVKDSKKIIGILKEVLEDSIKVFYNNKLVQINFADIHKAKTVFEEK